MGDQEGRFSLADEEDAFKEKAGTLFDALNGVQYSPTQDADGFLKSDPLRDLGQPGGRSVDRYRMGNRPKHGRGVTSSLMPPPRRPVPYKRKQHATPGHLKDPSKFTKYSLDDIPEEQLSQKSNTAAALAFLREIDEKKRKDEADADDTPTDQKPVFKKPMKRDKDTSQRCMSSSTKASDLELTDTSKPKHRVCKRKEVKLSHLEYDDE